VLAGCSACCRKTRIATHFERVQHRRGLDFQVRIDARTDNCIILASLLARNASNGKWFSHPHRSKLASLSGLSLPLMVLAGLVVLPKTFYDAASDGGAGAQQCPMVDWWLPDCGGTGVALNSALLRRRPEIVRLNGGGPAADQDFAGTAQNPWRSL
jgi:hypothetical protein